MTVIWDISLSEMENRFAVSNFTARQDLKVLVNLVLKGNQSEFEESKLH